jgi:hypothetical protein
MKNIHVLPTDKPSRLYLNTQEYIFENGYSLSTDECQNKHIYITSDEEIKEGDWFYIPNQMIGYEHISNEWSADLKSVYAKKIILTTDQDLIKDGVQAIEDEFLEWFVKNPSCEFLNIVPFDGYNAIKGNYFGYEIIIPKEEPKEHIKFINENIHELDRKMKYFKHKVETIPAEEILANRSNAYEFIDLDLGLEELNPHIGPFLLKNGFEKFKYEDNIYTNSECTINVLEGCYEILFENEYGEVSTYTDSWSIPHLVGTLTWNDLIDKNYNK